MKLKEILSITGAPGLWKYVAQGRGGIIVEQLDGTKRTMVSGAAKVSGLGDIAIYTTKTEIPLSEVYTNLFKTTQGKECGINKNSDEAQLREFMAKAVPDYDEQRVHNSDIRKLGIWFNTLVEAGMTDFSVEEQDKEHNPAMTEESAVATGKTQATKKAASTTVKQPKTISSRPKVVATKSTTNRKSQ
ncbi:MAG: DUF5606 domain-containing protein [Mucinivorans sp.]